MVKTMKTRVIPFFVVGLFLVGSACAQRGGTQGSGVNPFLWRAALDTVSLMPLTSAQPQGGVIITEWQEQKPNERIKLTLSIITSDLRADGIRVSVFRQIRKSGRWTDAPTSKGSALAVENLILTKARALRLGFVR